MILDKIQKENDIKKLNKNELDELSDEIRDFLISSISQTGGHLASNLGVVELTMALHLSFNLPKDKIIWDVGHQSYTHKILTGRKEEFAGLRQMGGISGFPKTNESKCDAFDTGHSSTSISAGLGMAEARDILKQDYYVVSVIGDGALTGGLAFEALNNASHLKKNFIIVLNDNEMSISKNVGGMNTYLSNFRTADSYRDLKDDVLQSLNKIPVYGEKMVQKIRNAKSSVKQLFVPGMIFEEMGIMYLGPVDGNNISDMCKVLKEAKRVDGPVLVHVITKKGRGYAPAVRHPARFHGTDAFDVKTGLPVKKQAKANYTNVFSTIMTKLGERNDKVVAITAAMDVGTGLTRFKRMFPDRFFDVGIAEAHAVTFAAGLAASGLRPIFAVYSSFLQRAYDEILHDVCIQKLPVIFAIDRAGLVGSDGETHQGIYDLSYLSSIPNMTVMAPKNKWELSDMMKFALTYDGPIAIRYPRGEAYDGLKEKREMISYGKAEMLSEGKEIALFAIGSMVKTAEETAELLRAKGYLPTVVNARFATPFDAEMITELSKSHRLIVTMEENIKSGGFGEHISEYVLSEKLDTTVLTIALPNTFVEQGKVDLLKDEFGLTAEKITKRILEEL